MEPLKQRFLKHMNRHQGLTWEDVLPKLNEDVLKSIDWMEETGGEPDVIVYQEALYVVDMSKESPKGRRSVCYDRMSRINRKKFPPATSALELCEQHKVSLVDEAMYFYIQSLEPLDLKTSSWVLSESSVREASGAIFGDHRFGRTFIYHNGADSYYGARGFRTYIKL